MANQEHLLRHQAFEAAKLAIKLAMHQMPGHLQQFQLLNEVKHLSPTDFHTEHVTAVVNQGFDPAYATEAANIHALERGAAHSTGDNNSEVWMKELPSSLDYGELIRTYFKFITHEHGHNLAATYKNVDSADAAKALGLTEAGLVKVLRSVFPDSISILLYYLNTHLSIQSQDFFDKIRPEVPKNETIIDYVSKLLTDENRKSILFTDLGIDEAEYLSFIDHLISNFVFDIQGRKVTPKIEKDGTIRSFDTFGLTHHGMADEILADTYWIYCEYLQWKSLENKMQNKHTDIRNFLGSQHAKQLLSPDESRVLPIIKAAIAFGSFENLLDYFIKALDIEAKNNGLSGAKKRAIQDITKASQIYEIITHVYFTLLSSGELKMILQSMPNEIFNQFTYSSFAQYFYMLQVANEYDIPNILNTLLGARGIIHSMNLETSQPPLLELMERQINKVLETEQAAVIHLASTYLREIQRSLN